MVSIEKLRSEHLDQTYRWMQDEELRRMFLFRRNITKESHLEWYEKLKKDTSQKIQAISFNDLYVGNIGIKDFENNNAETWIYLGNRKVKGKGIGQQAYNLFHTILKDEFELKSLYCYIASFNMASEKLYLKLGYVKEEGSDKKDEWDGEQYTLHKYTLEL